MIIEMRVPYGDYKKDVICKTDSTLRGKIVRIEHDGDWCKLFVDIKNRRNKKHDSRK